MTNQHPLTDEICEEISLRGISITMPIERNNMREAADWQLGKVIEWLDENLCNYNTGTESCPGFFWPMSRLTVDLERAMRPTNTQEEES